jgi:tRNA-modifying protein YgfZ
MPMLRCTPLEGRGVVRLGGADARNLLQGLISNDITFLTPAQALYAALLTPQGKYLFDFLLHDRDGSILLDTERERLPALVQRLTMYRLRSDVTLEDAGEELAVLAIFGPGGAVPPGAVDDAAAIADPRLPELGLRAVLPRARVADFVARHGLERAEPAQYERLRLSLGVPDGSRDLVVDKSLLLESGFEELNGVSFTKGCFVGQELTARTKHRGLVKRRLLPVRVDGPLPAPGTPITRAGKDAGEVRSGAGDLALALLRLEPMAAPSDEPLVAGEAALTPAPPPWLPLSALRTGAGAH